MTKWVIWGWTERYYCYKTGSTGQGCRKDVRDHIRTCGRCERFKDKPDREEIEQTDAHYPLELVHVDFLTIGGKKDVRKDINVLVVTDHFTRYSQAYVTTSQTAITVAKSAFHPVLYPLRVACQINYRPRLSVRGKTVQIPNDRSECEENKDDTLSPRRERSVREV